MVDTITEGRHSTKATQAGLAPHSPIQRSFWKEPPVPISVYDGSAFSIVGLFQIDLEDERRFASLSRLRLSKPLQFQQFDERTL
jgi:hypothetical protein